MKKQLLIAAVAASMTSVAMADISITGGAKANYTNTDYENTTAGADANGFNHDVDFTLVGKSGDTSVSMTVSNATTGTTATKNAVMTVENVSIASKIGDVNVKMGQWTGSDSLLGDGSATRTSGRFSADTTVGGVKIQFEDQDTKTSSITLSGEVQGVALSHEIFSSSTDTKISATVAGISGTFRSVDVDGANSGTTTDKTSLELSTEVSGITVTYAKVDADTGTTTSDGYLGTFASAVNEIEGFGVSTSVAGNTVAVKSISSKATNGAADDDQTKIVITRPLASGATFEATYTDFDYNAANSDKKTLDLELAVKF